MTDYRLPPADLALLSPLTIGAGDRLIISDGCRLILPQSDGSRFPAPHEPHVVTPSGP